MRKGNNRDINGDGYPDLVVGADQYNTSQGRVYIFLSRGTSGLASQGAASANAIITGETTNDQFGISLALDDFNGDGYDDLIVGAFQYSAGGNTGRVYVFAAAGQAGISASSPGSAAAILTGEGASNRFGRALPF